MKVLVPVDFSEITNPSLRTARRILEAHGGEIILFHAVSPAIYIPYPESLTVDVIDFKILQEIERTKKKEAEEKLLALARFFERIPVNVLVEVGDPRDLILEVEEKESPDLLILGSHRKGLVERILVGSTAEKVVKHSKKPVLVIKGSEPSFGKEVLIAYDFSKTAERMLDLALDFLRPFKVKVRILHIDEPIELPVIERIGKAMYERYRQEKKKYMGNLEEKFRKAGFDVSISFLEDSDPAEGIVNFVREHQNVELLIMGSRGLSGLKKILLGSTSTEVFRRIDIPILIYKEG